MELQELLMNSVLLCGVMTEWISVNWRISWKRIKVFLEFEIPISVFFVFLNVCKWKEFRKKGK